MGIQKTVKILLLVILAVVLIWVVKSPGVQDLASQKTILAYLERMGAFAPLGFMAIMTLTVASPLPSLPLDIAAGVFF